MPADARGRVLDGRVPIGAVDDERDRAELLTVGQLVPRRGSTRTSSGVTARAFGCSGWA
ncbi:hypothetical protein P9209_21865 [Prescottella defluvii]|nr:hypothetical protein P9209_21865 [Prescottella defluvii]